MNTTVQPSVGIVILNWKRPQEILETLSSVQRHDYRNSQVVVVDNASNNGSIEQIQQLFPQTIVLENGRNLGFAGGCNVGITYLLERGVDYILLLNDDTEVAPDMLSTLVGIAEREPRVGILGPNIFYYEPSNVLWSAGGSVTRIGQPNHLHVDQSPEHVSDAVTDVDYVTGCGMLIKRAVIDRVGALDERFFAYFEETELCARARRAGFRVVHVPQTRMWHKIGQNERAQSRGYLYLMTRNRLLYVKCTGASLAIQALAVADVLRTAASWTLRPRHRSMRPFASALTLGVLHFCLGRFGAPPVSP